MLNAENDALSWAARSDAKGTRPLPAAACLPEAGQAALCVMKARRLSDLQQLTTTRGLPRCPSRTRSLHFWVGWWVEKAEAYACALPF